jgi:futalosine hydrolase
MSLNILIVAATETEARTLDKVNGIVSVNGGYVSGKLNISVLVTGVGTMPSAWSMMHRISENGKPDLAINIGIAGSFREQIVAGEVVMPVQDCFSDYGIEDGEGFITLFEAGLAERDEFPYKDGLLPGDQQFTEKLKHIVKPVKAITRGTSTGSLQTTEALVRKYDPDIETMEGASFFYICRRESIPYFALRSVSNRVERRNRASWDIPLALRNLSLRIEEVFNILE